MSLPPGFLDELKSRLPLSQVVGRKVTWDARKSQPHKGDHWAPCPFHQEKTASFHVLDGPGIYKCFGCQASGDMISFVRETENMGFMEAVELLAGEAGMQMPARDPRAREKADASAELVAVMEEAQRWFRLNLSTRAAEAARAYLARRGLKPETIERFGIGFAPDSWDALREALTGKGIAPEKLIACGLLKASDKGRAPFAVFRDRIMFPIRDPRGRLVAFGGRAMKPDDPAKYINSPETVLFDKSRTVYNFHAARAEAGRGRPMVLCEGYMDVIALSEGGFPCAVAPMGTAVTEEQLKLIWRAAPEPVLMLDGDKAGLNGAYRALDRALPMLGPEQTLRFAILPAGQDPDDLIRGAGPEAVQALLDGARPLVDLLWMRETDGRRFDSPERKSALDAALRKALKAIPDPGLRRHYGAEIDARRRALFGYAEAGPRPGPAGPGYGPGGSGGARRGGAPGGRRGTGFATVPVPVPLPDPVALREATVLATLARYPDLIDGHADLLDLLPCAEAGRAALRDALAGLDPGALDPEAADPVADRLAGSPAGRALETLRASRHVGLVPCLRAAPDPEGARQTLREVGLLLKADRGWQAEIEEGAAELEGLADEVVTRRLRDAAEGRFAPGGAAETTVVAVETAANGATLDREELERARAAQAAALARLGGPGQGE
jgi:DNA primase